MTRYLTPSKVALLALVSVYTDGVIPNSEIVSVLSFLISHLLPLDPSTNEAKADPKLHTVPIEEIETATLGLASSVPGRTVWDHFLKKIWQIDCVDALDEFFSTVSGLLVKKREEQVNDRDNGIVSESTSMRLSRSSPLGTFVRRAQLEFTRLQFHDAVALWKRFIKYRLPTYHVWAKRNPLENKATIDTNLVELEVDLASPLATVAYGNMNEDIDREIGMSNKDMERLLEFQIGEIQSIYHPYIYLSFSC